MSNSSLVDYVQLSPNCSTRGGAKITKITPHHMAGVLSVESCGNTFASSSRQASSNYGIGSDGRIGLYVDESMRSWASSNYENDRQAVTIEVSNSAVGDPWPISDAAWNSLVNLCVDICQRNGIKGLTWTGGPDGTLTCHYMFAPTACPGPTLKGRMAELANMVNARLNGETPDDNTEDIIDLEDTDMNFICQPDDQGYLFYYDGTKIHPAVHPDEIAATQMCAKECYGKELPTFKLGTANAPWASRFMALVHREG